MSDQIPFRPSTSPSVDGSTLFFPLGIPTRMVAVTSAPYNAPTDGISDATNAVGQVNTIVRTSTGIGGVGVFTPGRYRFAANITLDTTATFLLMNGAVLVPDSGVTITINCPFLAPALAQCIDLSHGGSVLFSPVTNPTIQDMWFGSKHDFVSNDSVFINQAINAIDTSGGKGGNVGVSGGPILLGSGVADGIILRTNVKVICAGRRNTLFAYSGSGSAIKGTDVALCGITDFRMGLLSAGVGKCIDLRTAASSLLQLTFERFDLVGSGAASPDGQYGIYTDVPINFLTESLFRDFLIDSLAEPIRLGNTEGNHWEEFQIDRGGSATRTNAISGACNAERFVGRISGLGVGCPGITALNITAGTRNRADIVVDVNVAPSRALNIAQDGNILMVQRAVGVTPLGIYSPGNVVIDADLGMLPNIVSASSKLYPPTANTAIAAQTSTAVYAGVGAPTNALGNNGDAYIRGDTPGVANQRYYVRSAGAWVGIL